jgi:hypothetical protein
MSKCPEIVGGAKVILYTRIDDRHRHTGNTKQIVGGAVLQPAHGLAICQYEGENSFYLFGCDEQWNSVSDTWHASVEDAMSQAEFEYEGVSQTWAQP